MGVDRQFGEDRACQRHERKRTNAADCGTSEVTGVSGVTGATGVGPGDIIGGRAGGVAP